MSRFRLAFCLLTLLQGAALAAPSVTDDLCLLRGKTEMERLFLLHHAQVSANTPRWEGLTKNKIMLDADREFIEAIRKSSKGDLKQGATHSVALGWHAFDRGDFETAIRRFNQAWLLDTENAAIYWGYALITHVRNDGLAVTECWFDEAEKREIPPEMKASLYSDRGRVLDEKGDLPRARGYFEKALAADPNHVEAHIGMSRVLEAAGDKEGAQKHRDEVERLRKG